MQAQHAFYSQKNPAPLVKVSIREATELLNELIETRKRVLTAHTLTADVGVFSDIKLIDSTFNAAASQLGIGTVDRLILGFKTILGILEKEPNAEIVHEPIVLAINVIKLIDCLKTGDVSSEQAAECFAKITSIARSFRCAVQCGYSASTSDLDEAVIRPAVTEYFSSMTNVMEILHGLNNWRLQSINVINRQSPFLNNGFPAPIFPGHAPVSMTHPGSFQPAADSMYAKGAQSDQNAHRSEFQEKSEVPDQTKDKSPS